MAHGGVDEGLSIEREAEALAARRPSLEQLIVQKWSAPGWRAFYELCPRPGWDAGRIDVALIGAWNSNIGHRIACEVKRTRGDFLRDIRDPQKQSWVEQKFHETWYVCATDVAKETEVPEGWGLIVPTLKGDKLRVVRNPKRRDVGKLDEPLAIMMLRHVTEQAMRKRYVEVDGATLTRDELDALVLRRVSDAIAPKARENEAERIALHELRRTIEEERRLVHEPINEIRRLLQQGWRRHNNEVPTIEMIRQWHREIVLTTVKHLTSQLLSTADLLKHIAHEATNASAALLPPEPPSE